MRDVTAAIVLSLCAALDAAEGRIEKRQQQFGPNVLPSYEAGHIQLDGKLDEAAWQEAGTAADFSASKSRGILPFKTVVRALHNRDTIYLGVSCEVQDRASIVAIRPEGGKTYRDDSIEIFLDPGHDTKKCYQLIVNAAGRVSVIKIGDHTVMKRGDYLDAAAGWDEGSKSYILEIAISRKKLGIAGVLNRTIGLAFLRNQQVEPSGNRAYRYLWHGPDPATWGHLALLDKESFRALRESYLDRLTTITRSPVPEEFKTDAKTLKQEAQKLNPREVAGLTAFEDSLLALEKKAGWEYWKRKFEALFGGVTD